MKLAFEDLTYLLCTATIKKITLIILSLIIIKTIVINVALGKHFLVRVFIFFTFYFLIFVWSYYSSLLAVIQKWSGLPPRSPWCPCSSSSPPSSSATSVTSGRSAPSSPSFLGSSSYFQVRAGNRWRTNIKTTKILRNLWKGSAREQHRDQFTLSTNKPRKQKTNNCFVDWLWRETFMGSGTLCT